MNSTENGVALQNMIRVIDAPCGSGKSEWAISHMNENPDESFIFVTPYLDEVARVEEKTKASFYEPKFYNRPNLLGGDAGSKRKIEDFNDLLSSGKNVVTTHSTFVNATDETVNILLDNQYHLIVDEAIDVIVPLNDIQQEDEQKRQMNKDDAKLMLDNHLISVDDETRRVCWIGGGSGEHKYSAIQRFAENGTLLLIDGKFFLWEFPPDIFRAMQSVTILTYRIEGSFFEPYLKLHDMDYQKFGVSGTYNEGFLLTPYRDDLDKRQEWKNLITLWQPTKPRQYGSLSATWFRNNVEDKPKSDEAKALKNSLLRYFRDVNAAPDDVMWTVPKGSRKAVAPQGYKEIRELTTQEKTGRTKPERDEYIDNNNLRCWVASNARATNNYANRHILAYAFNLNPNPEITKYFASRGIAFKSNEFALSGLIQWIWRSAIRKGEPITLYLPSPRMYKLFSEWLDGKL